MMNSLFSDGNGREQITSQEDWASRSVSSSKFNPIDVYLLISEIFSCEDKFVKLVKAESDHQNELTYQ